MLNENFTLATYELPETRGGGGEDTPGQLKSKVPGSAQIFIFGGLLQTNIPEILEWGHSRDFEHKFIPLELATASQIVSHTLRMYRQITKRERAVIG